VINALKTMPNLGHLHTGFWWNLGSKLINYKWYAKCVFCPITQNFLLVGPYFQRVFFSATMASIALIVWGVVSIKFLAIENMPPRSSCPLWPNGWMYQDTTWYGGTLRPRRHCVRWRPSSPLHTKGHSSPHFSAPAVARILHITPIVDYMQCAAGGSRGNPTG